MLMNISATTYSNFPVGINVPAAGRTPQPAGQSPDLTQVASVDQASENRPFNSRVNDASPNDQTTSQTDPSKQGDPANPKVQQTTQTVNGHELTQEELRVLDQLKQADREVRQHEMAHVAAGGRYITSAANFSYKRGPDGRNYAVGGEVGIDTSPIPGDPQATLQKMRQVKTAALAPANPSSQDLKVAANASAAMSKALSDIMVLQAQEQAQRNQTQAFSNISNASDNYQHINNLPETDTHTFQIAV